MIRNTVLLTALLLAVPTTASRAEVVVQSEAGFVIKHSAETTPAPADTWRILIAPAKWWSSDHTWSHDAANLYLDAQASGCFCEKLPKPTSGLAASNTCT